MLLGLQRTALDHGDDVVEVPMDVLRLVLDDDLRGANAIFLDLLGDQAAAWQSERIEQRLNRREFDAGVD